MYFQRSTKKRQPNSKVQCNPASGEPSTSRAPTKATSTAAAKKQPYRSVNTYLDRIPIAGVHNYLYAQGKFEKITWNITFLLAIAGTLYYLVPTVQQYLKFTIVLDIQHQITPSVRLPNPWVCHSAVNVTYLRQEFEKVKPQLEVDKRVRVLKERYRKIWKQANPVVVDQLIGVALIFMTYAPMFGDEANGADVGKEGLRPQFAFEFMSKAVDAMGSNWTGTKMYDRGMFECQSIVMNCSLNGIPFDCCRDGPMGYNRLLDKCFALDIRREVAERSNQQNQTKSMELKFETMTFDPSFEFLSTHPDLAVMGNWTTISFDNRIAGLFDYIQVLDARSESVITVKGTKKKKLAQCMHTYKYRPQLHPKTHSLIREYFEDMVNKDRYSVAACQLGTLFEVLFHQCGCVPYYDTLRPQDDNVICTPAHARACVYRAFQNDPSVSAVTNGAKYSPMSVENDMKRDLFRNIKNLIATECVQLCESWIYDYTVISSNIDDLDMTSINRTKVTIVFDPEYRLETEMYKMDPSAFIASLSSGLMLILGCSGITLVQVPIWSIVACLFKRKQMKVSAVSTVRVKQ